MKFSKKRNQYEASNVTCNLTTLEAFSYDWWQFLAVINDKLVFNNYSYSNTTAKHQSKVRNLLSEHGIKVDMVISSPKSLHNLDCLDEAIEVLKSEREEVKDILGSNRRKKTLDMERYKRLAQIEQEIVQIEYLIHGSKLSAVMA